MLSRNKHTFLLHAMHSFSSQKRRSQNSQHRRASDRHKWTTQLLWKLEQGRGEKKEGPLTAREVRKNHGEKSGARKVLAPSLSLTLRDAHAESDKNYSQESDLPLSLSFSFIFRDHQHVTSAKFKDI